MVGIGVLSYSLYLWQQPFLWEGGQVVLGRWPTNIIIAVLVALASYRVVERPFLKIKGRVSSPDGPEVGSFGVSGLTAVGARGEN